MEINQQKSKTLIDYWKKWIKIRAFNEAHPCGRALFLLREYLFDDVCLNPFPVPEFRTHPERLQ
jgi:hypothetical protein